MPGATIEAQHLFFCSSSLEDLYVHLTQKPIVSTLEAPSENNKPVAQACITIAEPFRLDKTDVPTILSKRAS